MSCVISGLKPHIRREVQALQPMTLTQAISFAKIQEEKHNEMHNYPKNAASLLFHGQPSTSLTTALPVDKPPLSPKAKQSLPIKRLNLKELQERCLNGLHYICHENISQDIKCKSPFFLIVKEDTDTIPTDLPEPQFNASTLHHLIPVIQISRNLVLHAMLGHKRSQTLRLNGKVSNQHVNILIDSGNAHNFLQDRVAKFLGLPTSPTTSFHVMVGNGDQSPL